MKPIVPLKESESKKHLPQSNTNKVIRKLAENGKMSKWDIYKETGLKYPRVNETIAILKKAGLVERAGEKQAKNKQPSPRL